MSWQAFSIFGGFCLICIVVAGVTRFYDVKRSIQ